MSKLVLLRIFLVYNIFWDKLGTNLINNFYRWHSMTDLPFNPNPTFSNIKGPLLRIFKLIFVAQYFPHVFFYYTFNEVIMLLPLIPN